MECSGEEVGSSKRKSVGRGKEREKEGEKREGGDIKERKAEKKEHRSLINTKMCIRKKTNEESLKNKIQTHLDAIKNLKERLNHDPSNGPLASQIFLAVHALDAAMQRHDIVKGRGVH
jgi:hypothetical protein